MTYGISLDVSRCSGCMSCVVACMDQNDIVEGGPSLRHVVKVETGAYPSAHISFVSLSCFHCGDAPCLQACPKKAIYRHDILGAVLVDEKRCIGCHVCAEVCPFGAPRFLAGAKMRKCDLCTERIEEGKDPACVQTCPTRALSFGTMARLSSKKAWKTAVNVIKSVIIEQ
jgi:anaerobic dimethyl sulfoxide reductase subunit B